MIRIRQGKVLKIEEDSPDLTEVLVETEGEQARAINYNRLTGPVTPGDIVVLNTTALYKALGTGGKHFVMANLSLEGKEAEDQGHIMKLRYTPGQVKCLSVEEEKSPYHRQINDTSDINQLPVIVSTLHSMLPAVIAGIRTVKPHLGVVFIMTDGAALPIWFSNLTVNLKKRGWISSTITVGNAFGGDLEAVNIYTGLIAAQVAAKADIAIVGMGPGIVGTSTPLGFTGTEQGEIINAVNILGGRAIAVPRISFADPRDRHYGISHHSQTALGRIALTKAKVAIPQLESEKMNLLKKQMIDSGISKKHEVLTADGSPALELLKSEGIKVTTMGRDVDQDREFFLACGAAGVIGAQIGLS